MITTTKAIKTTKAKQARSAITATRTTLFDDDKNNNNKESYDSRFNVATSGILSYRINILDRLQAKSKENASTIIDYLFSMHNGINPSAGYKASQIVT